MAQVRQSFFPRPAQEDTEGLGTNPPPPSTPAHATGAGGSAFGRQGTTTAKGGARGPGKPKGKAAATPQDEAGEDLGRLKRLGFQRQAECLMSIPKGYRDCTTPQTTLNDSMIGSALYTVLQPVSCKLFDASKNEVRSWLRARRMSLVCQDAAGLNVTISAFGFLQEWAEQDLRQPLHLHGLLEMYGGALYLSKVELVPASNRGRVMAQYAGLAGSVSGETLRLAIEAAWDYMEEAEVLLLAHAGLRESEFTEITGVKRPGVLLQALHRPRTLAQGEKAMKIARRLTAETVVRRAALQRQRHPHTLAAIPIARGLVEDLIARLPFPLTGDQRKAIDEIVDDLRSAYPMKRLLSGDVGTGKSVTFMVPLTAAYLSGASVGIVAPTELLVGQIAKELRGYFPDVPVCEVVGGSKLEEGIAVGTTALLHAAKRAQKRFHLVVTDEQHKFSTQQKAALASTFTNTLEATATAIPRSLALVAYGDMDVSVLRECPVQKCIDTKIVNADEEQKVTHFVRRIVGDGGQVAVIYPLVDKGAGAELAGDSNSPATARQGVMEGFEAWNARFPGRVGVLHGKQSSEEKAAVIEAMKAKKIDVLVSTLVLEVGVTLPSLKALLVTSPECFGLAQLHQLRGRVARHGGQGWMVVLARSDLTEESMERLRTLRACNDGFQLAEHDMNIRGFGDVSMYGSAQVGGHRVLFHNTGLTHDEIKASAQRLGMRV